jgi:hypothetical protein
MFESPSGTYFIDRTTVDTVPRLARGRRIWTKLAVTPGQVRASGDEEIDHTLSRTDLDCDQRRMRGFVRVSYDAAGNVIRTSEVPADSAKWSSVIPDTNGEAMLQWTCSALSHVLELWSK